MVLFAKAVNRLIVLLVILSAGKSYGQSGGRSSFEFLNVPSSARLSGLGGVNVSLADRDINFFSSNPSLAGDTLAGVAAANYQFYVGGVGLASFAYGHDFGSLGMFSFAIQHMSYGVIDGYDATGAPTASFDAGETALIIGKAHTIGNFRLGANVKGVFSNLAGYRSSALLFDAGGLFVHPNRRLTVGLAIKNAGFALSHYSDLRDVQLPFDVQLGASFKPEHMPLRFSLTAFNLTGNAAYFNPSIDQESASIIEEIASHLNGGMEIFIHRNVTVLAGYNHFLHQSLKLENSGAGAGISFGFAASVRNFDFVVSRSAYVAGKAGYTFSLAKDIDHLFKRK